MFGWVCNIRFSKMAEYHSVCVVCTQAQIDGRFSAVFVIVQQAKCVLFTAKHGNLHNEMKHTNTQYHHAVYAEGWRLVKTYSGMLIERVNYMSQLRTYATLRKRSPDGLNAIETFGNIIK